ncbi:MAG: hypothetical protein IT380_23935 [Myxococcales bacterium]|nr:hypothetical protein [Myxococcales bacterium]
MSGLGSARIDLEPALTMLAVGERLQGAPTALDASGQVLAGRSSSAPTATSVVVGDDTDTWSFQALREP